MIESSNEKYQKKLKKKDYRQKSNNCNYIIRMLKIIKAIWIYILSIIIYFKKFIIKEKNNYRELKLDSLLKYVIDNKAYKLDIDNDKYKNLMSKIDINENNLASFEISLFNKLSENLNKYDYTKNKNLNSKFYIKSCISHDKIESMENNNRNKKDKLISEINNDTNKDLNNELRISETIKHNIDNSNICINIGDITLEEFNNSYRDNSSIDIFGICKKNIYDLSLYNKIQLIRIYNNILNNPELLNDYCFGKCSFVYKEAKRGPKDELSSYRTVISMPNTIIYLNRIIALRLNEYLNKNNYINTTIQKGGVSGLKFGIFEQIIKLKNIIKYANKWNKELCVMFIDIKDAFPSMPISIVCDIMKEYHIDEKIVNYVRTYYSKLHYYYDTPNWKSNLYKWNKGLLQGCPLSSLLFVLVINYILEKINKDFYNSSFEMIRIHKNENNEEVLISNKNLFLAYIDDIAITAKDEESMILIYNKLKDEFNKINLLINKDKTEYMHINPTTLDNKNNLGINEVISYTYLGEKIYKNGDSIQTYKILVMTIKSLLFRLDKNNNYDNDKKMLYLNKILIPKIQRKFYIMYDIPNEMKEKLLKFINIYINKWNGNSEILINLGIDREKLLETTNDTLLLNTDIIDFNIEENSTIINIENVKFEYGTCEINVDIEDIENINDN